MFGEELAGSNLQESIAIGYNAKVSGSNMCAIGGTGADSVKVIIGGTSAINTLDVVGNISCSVITASLAGTSSYSIASIINSITTIYNNYTASVLDCTILCNPTASIGVNLPSSIAVGAIYNVKNISSYSITVTPTAGLIDGMPSQIISNRYTNMSIQFDGTNWYIL